MKKTSPHVVPKAPIIKFVKPLTGIPTLSLLSTTLSFSSSALRVLKLRIFQSAIICSGWIKSNGIIAQFDFEQIFDHYLGMFRPI